MICHILLTQPAKTAVLLRSRPEWSLGPERRNYLRDNTYFTNQICYFTRRDRDSLLFLLDERREVVLNRLKFVKNQYCKFIELFVPSA